MPARAHGQGQHLKEVLLARSAAHSNQQRRKRVVARRLGLERSPQDIPQCQSLLAREQRRVLRRCRAARGAGWGIQGCGGTQRSTAQPGRGERCCMHRAAAGIAPRTSSKIANAQHALKRSGGAKAPSKLRPASPKVILLSGRAASSLPASSVVSTVFIVPNYDTWRAQRCRAASWTPALHFSRAAGCAPLRCVSLHTLTPSMSFDALVHALGAML